MSDKKEFEAIRRRLEKKGWTIRHGGKHIWAYPPDKSMAPLSWPSSPGGGRALANFKAALKRRGFDPDKD